MELYIKNILSITNYRNSATPIITKAISNWEISVRSFSTVKSLATYEGYQDFELYKNIFSVPSRIDYYLESDALSGYCYGTVTWGYDKNTGSLSVQGKDYRVNSGSCHARFMVDVYIVQ